MVDLVQELFEPKFVVMLLAALATVATVVAIALPVLSRDRSAERMKVMAVERDKMRASRMADLIAADRQGSLRQAPKGYMQQLVDLVGIRKAFDNDETRDRLKMAGLRGQGPIVAYMFFRVIAPPAMTVVALIYLFVIAKLTYPPIAKFAMALGAGYLGYYLPNIFINNMVQKRQQSIKDAFPDSLDMLLICVQSGMSIELAFAKVAREVGASSMELAEEYSLTTAELSYLTERRQAYENLAKRTGIDGVKSVATALIQAERYGTPVGAALRVMAKENRDLRMADAEAKAAALPPKLTVPMIVFFLPVLFIVILGPAVMQVMQYR